MKMAIEEAKKASLIGEVPIGAVLVKDNKIVSSAHNMPIKLNDPSAHAEINVLRDAGEKIGNYRLNECDLYVTLEPCLMCFGACIHARINNLIYASDDPKSGVITSNLNLADETFLNHKISITKGVLSEESSQLLKAFFKERRVKN